MTGNSQEKRLETKEGMNKKKATCEEGITVEIYKLTFKIFPKSITAFITGT